VPEHELAGPLHAIAQPFQPPPRRGMARRVRPAAPRAPASGQQAWAGTTPSEGSHRPPSHFTPHGGPTRGELHHGTQPIWRGRRDHRRLERHRASGGARVRRARRPARATPAAATRPLNETAEACRQLGTEALAVPADVTDPGAVEALARQAEERFGGIDVWVNNAGVYLAGSFEDTPLDAFRQVMEINFFGSVNGARAALPRLRASQGILINIASVAGAATYPFFSAYVASKWAVRGWSATLRQELFGSGVDVCTILPASIDTPLFQHAANYTGWFLKAMNPIYTPGDGRRRDDPLRRAPDPRGDRRRRRADDGDAVGDGAAPGRAHVPRPGRIRPSSAGPAVAPKDGNLYEPMREGTETTGGWGGSRLPDRIAGATTVGLAVAGSARGLVATRGSKNGHVGPVPIPFRRRRAASRSCSIRRRGVAPRRPALASPGPGVPSKQAPSSPRS
jgi:NAD(P)-dependent dehydrogenase (short-subunit alcohol dehydrogenase family)